MTTSPFPHLILTAQLDFPLKWLVIFTSISHSWTSQWESLSLWIGLLTSEIASNIQVEIFPNIILFHKTLTSCFLSSEVLTAHIYEICDFWPCNSHLLSDKQISLTMKLLLRYILLRIYQECILILLHKETRIYKPLHSVWSNWITLFTSLRLTSPAPSYGSPVTVSLGVLWNPSTCFFLLIKTFFYRWQTQVSAL